MRAGNRKAGKRVTALAFLLCFLIAALFSEAFLLTRASHEHHHMNAGGECIVCAQIRCLENLLKQFGAAAGGILMALLGLFAAIAALCRVSALQLSTPVRLKTRLNN